MFCGQKIQQNLHQNTSLSHSSHGILPSLSPLPTVFLHLLQRRETPQKRFKFQLVLFLWELLPCRMQCHVGWVPLRLPCCTAASIHSPRSLKPRAQRNKFPHSPPETQKRVFGMGIVTTGGMKAGTWWRRSFSKMRTAAQTPGHISANLRCLCARSDIPQLLIELAVVGLHEQLILERNNR